MSGQSANMSRSEVISRIRNVEKGPGKNVPGGHSNTGHSGMNAKIPIGKK